jgi:hypothetical protein
MSKLKIDTAEDLIEQCSPGHAACAAAKSIAWSEDGDTIDIQCGCGLTLSYGLDYLAELAIDAAREEDAEKSRKKLRSAKIASKNKVGSTARNGNSAKRRKRAA